MKVLIIVAVLLFSSGCDFGKGRYTVTAPVTVPAAGPVVYILDTKEGHLWLATAGSIRYIGQPKVGEEGFRRVR